MLKYAVMRLALALPVLLAMSIVLFGILQLVPGDAVTAGMTGGANISQAQQDLIRESLGLNRSVVEQLSQELVALLRGDLGQSLRSGRSVTSEILAQLPSTLALVAAAMSLAIIGGFALGIVAARKPNSVRDLSVMGFASLGVAVPQFWLGLMLILVFAVWLGWLPVLSSGGIKGLILPTIALAAAEMAVLARLVRSSLIEQLYGDYTVTARAKGASESRIVYRHALRNSLIPVVTMIGLQVGNLLGAAVVIEVVFGRAGIGNLVVGAIIQRDMAIVRGSILALGAAFILVNIAVDIGSRLLDPRIRLEGIDAS